MYGRKEESGVEFGKEGKKNKAMNEGRKTTEEGETEGWKEAGTKWHGRNGRKRSRNRAR